MGVKLGDETWRKLPSLATSPLQAATSPSRQLRIQGNTSHSIYPHAFLLSAASTAQKRSFPKEHISKCLPFSTSLPHPEFGEIILQALSHAELPNYLHFKREIFPTNCSWQVQDVQCCKTVTKNCKQKNPTEQGASCPHKPIPAASIKGRIASPINEASITNKPRR